MLAIRSVSVLGLLLLARASVADEHAFFEQKIRPVLIKHCYECHSAKAEKVKGGLLLDSQAGWMAGGDSGEPVIVPGAPDESLLIQSVRYADGLEMPPAGKLPATIIADLEQWVASGAADPRTDVAFEAKRADKSWWSLQPLRPWTTDYESRSGSDVIDDLVSTKLAEKKLVRNPPADARQLIRRMSYDLLGLPPTPLEVEEFAAAFSHNPETATEALVDHLLASPHYGEQWGRHWLDVVRFGESNGFERNVVTNDIWPFRDYVIQSLNDDKPFNQFMVEHLAGDVVGKDQPEIEIGTAFLVAGPYDDVGNQDVVAQAQIRAATLDEIITATSGAFLGLTVNCARCHHHKFDPIPTADYYRLRAAFEGVTHGRRVVATAEQKQRHAAATKPLQAEKKTLTEAVEQVEKAIEARIESALESQSFARPKIAINAQFEERFPPVAARHLRLNLLASTTNPKSAVGSRLVEVEAWTTGADARNVALASNGGQAEGARSMVAEDFPDAYGPKFVIDGRTGEQWFIGQPAQLTLTFAKTEMIDRVTLNNAKGSDIHDKAQGATPCEYQIQVSTDGEHWTSVADSFDRHPWSREHAIQRLRSTLETSEETARLAELRAKLSQIDRQLSQVEPLAVMWVGQPQQPAEPTRLHLGGDPMKPGEVIAPASLEVLQETVPAYALPVDEPEAERRLALAKWITSDQNPLTPRVLANRVWQYHFGTGIVDTPSDFGFLGGQPTHPELIDWLATRLIANGWRIKALHRDILLSRTYRQSSQPRDEALAVDKQSRWLWRFPPRRLTAEEIRDTQLFVAGRLQGLVANSDTTNSDTTNSDTTNSDTTQVGNGLAGGPGFRLYRFTQNNVCTYFPLDEHGPETYRRAVYHQNARASVVDLLSDFDLPDNAFAAPVRANTTTPLQALTLLNHRFTLDMASALAVRARQESDSRTSGETVERVYRIVLQRSPTSGEYSAATALVDEFGLEAFCRAMLNLNEVLYVE